MHLAYHVDSEKVPRRGSFRKGHEVRNHMEFTNVMTVRTAGRAWLLGVDQEDDREALARWLGPWAVPARPSPDGDDLAVLAREEECVGLVTMTVAPPERMRRPDSPPAPHDAPVHPVLIQTTEGLTAFSDDYRFSFGTSDGMDRAAVEYVKGNERSAARAAFRLLVMRRVFAGGGIVLHSTSVRAGRGLLVFAGPSGAGKTTAAFTFPPDQRLDPDLVLLVERGGSWVRLDHFDEYEPRNFAPGSAAGIPVRAVLLPGAGGAFDLRFIDGAEATAACLHILSPAMSGATSAEVAALIERAERLARSVKVARLAWSLAEERDDLPRLLEDALG